jgi:hypothetical protein
MLFVVPECGYTFNTSLSTTEADTALVTNLIIYDESKRRCGRGRQLYTEWENSLPQFIKRAYLRAKSPDAEAFWRHMGFVRLYSEPELNIYENGGVPMIKHLRQSR